MSTDYYVTEAGPCSNCEGEQFIMHPLWKKFYEAHLGAGDITDQQINAWWSHEGVSKLPPTEITCPECSGLGRIERRVLLSSALKNMGVASKV
jgi:hypothetical protein